MAPIAWRRSIRFPWGQNRTAAVSRAMLDDAVSRLPADQAEVSFDTWYDLRAGLSTTRPGYQHHRAAAGRGSIKIPARFVGRFRTASYPRAIMRVAIRRFFQNEVPT